MRLARVMFQTNAIDPAGGTPRTTFVHSEYELEMDLSGTVLITSRKTGARVHVNLPCSWQEAPRVVVEPPPDPDKSTVKPLRKTRP